MLFTKSYEFNRLASRENSVRLTNRIALAPMTNQQSHDDGVVSEDEIRWLEARAKGGFGCLITCAAHVTVDGQGWPGEMGIFGDHLLPGLSQLSGRLNMFPTKTLVQLYHGGLRSPKSLTGRIPKAPTSYPVGEGKPDGCEALTLTEVHQLRDAFIAAAKRAHEAGFSGVELHGAHGYLIHQFLDPDFNQRNDAYGGDLDGRSRFLMEIVKGIRDLLPDEFLVAVRLSPDSYDNEKSVNLVDTVKLVKELTQLDIDIMHYSLWDFNKTCKDSTGKDIRPMDFLLEAHPKGLTSMVAGGFKNLDDVEEALRSGADLVALGRLAIANPDWPHRVADEPDYKPLEAPYTVAQLRGASLGEGFIKYMSRWPDFVSDATH